MKLSITLLCSMVFSMVEAGPYASDPHVLELTPQNFDTVVHGTNYSTLVEFYAPWCGHCKQLFPFYKKAGKAVADLAVQVAAVNCDEEINKPLCAQQRIEGFPTLMVFRPAKYSHENPPSRRSKHAAELYRGGRDTKLMVGFLTSRLKNNVKKINRLENLEKFVNQPQTKHKNKVILLTSKDKPSALIKTVAIDFLGSLEFAFMRVKPADAEALSAIFGSTIEATLPVVVLYNVETASYEVLRGSLSRHEIETFLVANGAQPLEGPLSKRGLKLAGLRGGTKRNAKPKKGRLSSTNKSKRSLDTNRDEL